MKFKTFCNFSLSPASNPSESWTTRRVLSEDIISLSMSCFSAFLSETIWSYIESNDPISEINLTVISAPNTALINADFPEPDWRD
jgi:hypothetical protein